MYLPLQAAAVSRGRAVRAEFRDTPFGRIYPSAGKRGQVLAGGNICPGGFLCMCGDVSTCCVNGELCCCGELSNAPLCTAAPDCGG
jgi:hypothetical protein